MKPKVLPMVSRMTVMVSQTAITVCYSFSIIPLYFPVLVLVIIPCLICFLGGSTTIIGSGRGSGKHKGRCLTACPNSETHINMNYIIEMSLRLLSAQHTFSFRSGMSNFRFRHEVNYDDEVSAAISSFLSN